MPPTKLRTANLKGGIPAAELFVNVTSHFTSLHYQGLLIVEQLLGRGMKIWAGPEERRRIRRRRRRREGRNDGERIAIEVNGRKISFAYCSSEIPTSLLFR